MIREEEIKKENNSKLPWINYKEEKPQFGIEIIGYHHKWVDEDFNPNGTRIGFLSDDGFTSAFWWDYQDHYEIIRKLDCDNSKAFYQSHIDNAEPEFWIPIPEPPKKKIKVSYDKRSNKELLSIKNKDLEHLK